MNYHPICVTDLDDIELNKLLEEINFEIKDRQRKKEREIKRDKFQERLDALLDEIENAGFKVEDGFLNTFEVIDPENP